MNQNLIKMYFDKALFRVRLIFKPDDLSLVVSFDPFIERVRDRMEQIKQVGQIAHYITYEDIFRELLVKGIAADAMDDSEKGKEFDCIVAQGFPVMHGIALSFDNSSERGISLKVVFKPAPELMPQWRWEWIVAYVERFMQSRGSHPGSLDNAALRALWLRAIKAMKPTEGILPLLDRDLLAAGDQAFKLVTYNNDLDLGLVVLKPEAIRTQEARHAMFDAAQKEIHRLSHKTGRTYTLQTEDIKAEIKNLLMSVHVLGFGLPVSFLVARSDSTAAAPASAPETRAPREKKSDVPPDKTTATPTPVAAAAAPSSPRLHLDIARDHLTATIVRFDPQLYQTHPQLMNIDWIRAELKRQGIVNHDASIDSSLQKILAAKGDLNGAVAAMGARSVSAAGPYVQLAGQKTVSENEVINFRESNRFHFFKKGELVARILYKVSPKAGADIRGQVLVPKEPEPFKLKVGLGVEEKGNGQYYATINGIATLRDNELSVENTLVIPGDVNLSTGNINFPGAVMVQGYIDMGARVICDGPLVVEKGITEAVVKCKGNVQVKEGIVTGKHGYVYAGGDLKADFIQNSTVRVRGDLAVKSAILNSQVVVDGNVMVLAPDGVIAGGVMGVFGSIATQNLGLRKGTHTIVYLGTRYEIERSLRIKTARAEVFKDAAADIQKKIRELRTRHKMQKQMEKLEETIATMQERAERWQKAREITLELVARLQEQVSYNQDAVLRIRGEALRTVEIYAGGKDIPRLSDLLEAVITVRPARGKNIFQLDEFEKAG